MTATNFCFEKGTVTVSATRTLSTDKMSVEIKPVAAMDIAGEYTLTVASAVKNADGSKTLGADVVNTFKVIDTLAITKVESPVGTALGTATTVIQPVVVTFNKIFLLLP